MKIDENVPCAPTEVPDLRNELIVNWGTSPGYRIAAQESSTASATFADGHREINRVHDTIDQMLQFHIRTLAQAELYWVGQEMCDLLYATLPKVPLETEPEHLPTPSPHGFVVLAKPWSGLDSNSPDNRVAVDAFTWSYGSAVSIKGELRDVITIELYRCVNWEKGLSASEIHLAQTMNLETQAKRATVLRDGRLAVVLTGKAWMPLGRSSWPLHQRVDSFLTEYGSDSPEMVQYALSNTEDRQLLAAFLSLIATHSIAQVKEAPLPRYVQRRDQKERKTKEPSKVKIVYLRRPEREGNGHDKDGHNFEYSHRFVVSAHPKLQPYGPNSSLRKLITVAAYVKGPDELPLVVKPTVNAWVR